MAIFVVISSSNAHKLYSQKFKAAISNAALVTATFLNQPIITHATAETKPIFEEVWKNVKENFYDDTYNKQDWDKLKNDYYNKMKIGGDDHVLAQNALNLLNDKYTRLVDKERYQSLWKYDAIGVGLLFQSDPGKEMTVSADPLPGSSSDKAGIKKDDLILSLNGISTKGKTALQLLDTMSNDDSAQVELEYSRPSENPPLTKKVTLVRAKEEVINPVTYSISTVSNGKKIGYAKLAEFNSKAVSGLEEAFKKFNNEEVDDVVLDLRGNLGGGFQFALNIGGMLMEDKLMVTALGRGDEKNGFRTSYPPGVLYKKPVVVLTDELSASASEVLASGLHDNCRAVLAGSRTFGKGKIQAVFGLSDGEGMTMTV